MRLGWFANPAFVKVMVLYKRWSMVMESWFLWSVELIVLHRLSNMVPSVSTESELRLGGVFFTAADGFEIAEVACFS